MPSNHLILCRPLLLLPSIFPSIRVFSTESVLHIRWPKFNASGGVSGLTSVLPLNTQDWFPLGWTGWISLQSKGLSRVFSNTTVQKHQFLSAPRTPYLSQDSPGRTELLNYISEVIQSCLTLWDPMDCSLPGFSIHGIFQARVLEWVAISFSINYISCFQIMLFCFVLFCVFKANCISLPTPIST